MKNYKISTRYAKALFDLVDEKNLIEQTREDMALIAQVYNDNEEFRHMLASPVISDSKKTIVLKSLFGDKVHPPVAEFMNILCRKGREMHIGHIAGEFVRLYQEHQGIKTAYVTTAVPLNEKMRADLIAKVQNYTGKKIVLVEKIDPAVLGGFVLKFDDIQYDASLAFQLNELRKEFSENIYVKGF